jgi:hypothetical protein
MAGVVVPAATTLVAYSQSWFHTANRLAKTVVPHLSFASDRIRSTSGSTNAKRALLFTEGTERFSFIDRVHSPVHLQR